MNPSKLLQSTGRTIGYRPKLAKLFGGVTAEIFFEQVFYWQDKADSEFGVYKTQEELEEETGLTRREQETARKKLRECGVLIETLKRLEHRLYFKIDFERLDVLLASLADEQNERSPMAETAIRDDAKPPFVNTLDYNTRLHSLDHNKPLTPKNSTTTNSTTASPLSADADAVAVGVEMNVGDQTSLVVPACPEDYQDLDLAEKLDLSEKSDFSVSSAKPKRQGLAVDYQAVVEQYNLAVSDTPMPQVRLLNDHRRRAIHNLAQLMKREWNDYSPEAFRNYFDDFVGQAAARKDQFYFGGNDRGWVADFDYVLRTKTLTKALENAL